LPLSPVWRARAARTAQGTLADILESVIFTAANTFTQTLRDTVVVAV
jgi:hypothetical protein